MSIETQYDERHGDRTLAQVKISSVLYDYRGEPVGTTHEHVWEVTCDACGGSIAQVEDEDEARSALSDSHVCPTPIASRGSLT